MFNTSVRGNTKQKYGVQPCHTHWDDHYKTETKGETGSDGTRTEELNLSHAAAGRGTSQDPGVTLHEWPGRTDSSDWALSPLRATARLTPETRPMQVPSPEDEAMVCVQQYYSAMNE